MSRYGAEGKSPIDAFPWPTQLTARLTTPDESAVAGYHVASDLARHWSFSDMLYLSVRGQLPSDRESRVLSYVLMNLAPISIAKAPAHAASLVRLCEGSYAATTGAAYLTAAEEGRFVIAAHAGFFEWLTTQGQGAPESSPPHVETPSNSSEATPAILVSLAALDLPLTLPATLPRESVLLAALHRIGIQDAMSLEFFWSAARGALALAEALRVSPRAFKSYPLALPRFDYIGGEES